MSAFAETASDRYPAVYEADYVERRSRLTTFFRGILVIPHLIVLFLLGFLALLAVVVAWFALLFTGRWPRGMYDFVVGVLRYTTRIYGYWNLVCDPYPPFDIAERDDYPVRLRVGPPLESYNRLKVLFRILLLIPVAIIAYAMYLIASIGALFSWFVIVITGKQPEGLQNMINLGLAYQVRAMAYYYLVTEDWPPFTVEG